MPDTMMGRLGRITVIAGLLCLAPAAHAADPAADPPPGGLSQDVSKLFTQLTTAEARYPSVNLFERTAIDFWAIPASVADWDRADWARFGVVAVPVGYLMWPNNPDPPDVRFQNWVQDHRSSGLDKVLYKIPSNDATYATFGIMGGYWGAALISDNPEVHELASLTTEALFVGQAAHVSIKMLLGREGPGQGSGHAEIRGPTTSNFPELPGTPSGHLITTAVLTGVVSEYYDSWTLRALSGAAMAYVATGSVYKNQHYLSDVWLGAGMGYGIAYWVVHHRSTRFADDADDGRMHVSVTPMLGAPGVQVSLTW